MDLRNISHVVDLRIKGTQHFSSNRGRRNATNRFPRRRAPSTLPVSDSVFCLVSEIGVGRPEFFFRRGVILRPRVFVPNQNSDRRPERLPLKDAGENFAAIFFLALGRDFALTGATTIELALNLRFRDVDLRRTTVNHHTDAAAVRLTKRRDPKQLAESAAHETEKLSQHRAGTTRSS